MNSNKVIKPFGYYKAIAKEKMAGKILKLSPVIIMSVVLPLFIGGYLKVFYKEGNEFFNNILSTLSNILIITPFKMGFTVFYMNHFYGKSAKVGDVFDGYKYIIKLIPYILVTEIVSFTSAWGMGFIIGASETMVSLVTTVMTVLMFVIQIYISFTTNFLYDEGEKGGIKALVSSIKLAGGNILYITGLYFSFTLWMFAIIFTFGIATLYVIPYMEFTLIALYEDLKNPPENIIDEKEIL
jgi:hypothetical protein